MKSVSWKIALYITLVFLAGVGVGVLAQRYVIPHSHPDGPGRFNPEHFRKAMVEGMTKRLHLDVAQVTQLQQILDDSGKEFHAFRESHKAEMAVIYDRQNTRIAGMLRPDQLAEFKKLQAEREAHRSQAK